MVDLPSRDLFGTVSPLQLGFRVYYQQPHFGIHQWGKTTIPIQVFMDICIVKGDR